MSALITAGQFALSFGTKKTPMAVAADVLGVSCAAGKAGTDARKAVKANMPLQAANGTFAPFAGYLAASFPKTFKAFMAGLEGQRVGLTALKAADPTTWTERHEAVLAEVTAFSLQSRMGFNLLVQFILNNPLEKPTKAQVEAVAAVQSYSTILAERAAKRAAKEATERAAASAQAATEPAVH